MHVHDAAALIRAEYERAPDLQLTFWQMQRLLNLSNELCERALTMLIRGRFLIPAADHTYVRRGARALPATGVTG
jgi:hypothetical protein